MVLFGGLCWFYMVLFVVYVFFLVIFGGLCWFYLLCVLWFMVVDGWDGTELAGAIGNVVE